MASLSCYSVYAGTHNKYITATIKSDFHSLNARHINDALFELLAVVLVNIHPLKPR
jgi:hypothetical protein